MQATTPMPASGSQARHRILDENHASIILLLKDAEASLSSDHNSARWYLTRALTMLRQREALPKASFGCLSKREIKRLTDYIDTHLDTPIRTSQLAAVLNLSISHFTRVFKNTFNVTPLIYVARYRIESACRIMLTTDLSLTEITYRHGFCDQSHFTRIFRRQIGVTPQTWRRLRKLELHQDPVSHTAYAKSYD